MKTFNDVLDAALICLFGKESEVLIHSLRSQGWAVHVVRDYNTDRVTSVTVKKGSERYHAFLSGNIVPVLRGDGAAFQLMEILLLENEGHLIGSFISV